MSAPPAMPQQDRADFERVLEQALAAEEIRAALPAGGLTAERLRVLARDAAPGILAAAAEEYGEYARLRAAAELSGDLGGQRPADGPGMLSGGGGLVGALAVLAPVLAGTAAVILFLIGSVLRFAESQRHLAAAVVEAAWTAAIIAAASAVCGVLGLLVTASRQRDPGSPLPLDPAAAELRQARTAWRTALLERGMLPFLRTTLGR